MTASITQKLADYAASTSVQAIPDAVKERAKHVILDEMASAYFASHNTASALAARYAASLDGAPESLILGTQLRVPAPYAALANGTAGHGDEIDGAHVLGGHPGSTVVHAAVAIAERQRASGADLLNAVVLGYDVGCRALEACGGLFQVKQRYHLHSDFLYGLGAAAAAARILGLDAVRHRYALALATFQANGLCALFGEKRHISKSFSQGQYAYAGVSGAQMAAIGMEGSEDILGARDGLLEAWGVEGGTDIVARGLGEDYSIMGANFKFVRAGYPIHAVVEAAMTLITEHKIDAGAITAVHVGMAATQIGVVSNREMHNICVQDMLAVALLRGGLRLTEEYFPEILSDPGFAPMRARISVAVDAGLERDYPTGRGANVSITTVPSGTVSHRVDWPRGHSRRGGVTWSDLSEKWHETLPECDVERMLRLAQRLEELEDVSDLVNTFQAAS